MSCNRSRKRNATQLPSFANRQTVPLGILETMLVEGSATDKERASEALDGTRVAQKRSEIDTLSAGACFSPGRGAFSPATGSRGGHLDPRPPMGASTHIRGRCPGWQAGKAPTRTTLIKKEVHNLQNIHSFKTV